METMFYPPFSYMWKCYIFYLLFWWYIYFFHILIMKSLHRSWVWIIGSKAMCTFLQCLKWYSHLKQLRQIPMNTPRKCLIRVGSTFGSLMYQESGGLVTTLSIQSKSIFHNSHCIGPPVSLATSQCSLHECDGQESEIIIHLSDPPLTVDMQLLKMWILLWRPFSSMHSALHLCSTWSS